MTQFVQALPSEDSESGRIARRLANLVGPSIQPKDGTAIAADLLGLGDGLADGHATNTTSLDQAFILTVTDMIGDWEISYGFPSRPDLPIATRQNRILAKVRAKRGAAPNPITFAVQTVVGTSPIVVFYENDLSNVPYYPRGVFQFGITIGSAFDDYEKLTQTRALVEQMKPAFTRGDIGASKGFILGTSILGRDLL